jgi:hypothetical protein
MRERKIKVLPHLLSEDIDSINNIVGIDGCSTLGLDFDSLASSERNHWLDLAFLEELLQFIQLGFLEFGDEWLEHLFAKPAEGFLVEGHALVPDARHGGRCLLLDFTEEGFQEIKAFGAELLEQLADCLDCSANNFLVLVLQHGHACLEHLDLFLALQDVSEDLEGEFADLRFAWRHTLLDQYLDQLSAIHSRLELSLIAPRGSN